MERRKLPAQPAGSRANSFRPPPIQPTQRITRSQSREVSDSDIEKGNTKRGLGPSNRQKNAKNRNRTAQDLSTVPEQSEVVYPDLSNDGDAIEGLFIKEGVDQYRRETKSPGELSAISAVTAQTSFSGQELAELNPEAMLDALPDICEAADKLLSFVVPQASSPENHSKLLQDLQDARSRSRNTLIRHEKTLRAQQESYGKEIYINRLIVLRAMLKVRHTSEIGYGPWRPDNIIYKVNIAIMTAGLFLPRGSSSSVRTMIEKLERDYPEPFLSESHRGLSQINTSLGQSALFEKNLRFGLEIRTQYLILLFDQHSQQPDFDANIILRQVFCEDEENLKGWDAHGLRLHEIGAAGETLIRKRIQNIKKTFHTNPRGVPDRSTVDIDLLRDAYSWSRFSAHALSWATLRRNEIEAHITKVGGLKNIQQDIINEMENRTAPDVQDLVTSSAVLQPQLSLSLDTRTEQAGASLKTRSSAGNGYLKPNFNSAYNIHSAAQLIADFKAKNSAPKEQPPEKQNSKDLKVLNRTGRLHPTTQNVPSMKRPLVKDVLASELARFAEQPTSRDNVHDGFQPQMEQDDMDLDSSLSSARFEKAVQWRRNPTVDQDKENVPKIQKRAKKLEDQQVPVDLPTSKKPRFVNESSSRQPRKSLEREEGQEDQVTSPSEDEGFQSDNRFSHLKRPSLEKSKKRIRNISSSIASTKRPRIERDDLIELEQEPGRTAAHRTSTVPLSQSEMYNAVNKQSKLVTAIRVEKPVQERKPWLREEEQRLIELIERYGTGYSFLKDIDNSTGGVLVDRGQVALKDKARNMKFDFLKSGVTLPNNFDRVPLGKVLIGRLRAAGIAADEEV